jgi:hypothetical protein
MIVISSSNVRLAKIAFALLFVTLIAAALAESPERASAEVSPMVGVWDGVGSTAYGPVPFRLALTAGNAATRQARFPSGAVITYWGVYEVVGSQLHIWWRRWEPGHGGPMGEDCMMNFRGPNQFECGGVVFQRQ